MECPNLFSAPSAPPSPTPLHFLFFSAATDLNKNHSASASSFTSKHERSRKRTVTSYLIQKRKERNFSRNQALLNRLPTSSAFLKKPLRSLS